MKKTGVILISIAGALVLLLLVLFGVAHAYLNSDGFQKQVVSEVDRKLCCEVKLEQMKVHILRGVDFVGIQVASDQVRPRDFLKADRLRVRYDLYEALFHRRVVLEELKLSTPQITVDLTEPPRPKPPPAPKTPPPEQPSARPADSEQAIVIAPRPELPAPKPAAIVAETEGGWPAPPPLDLKKMIVEDGALTLILPDHEKLVLNGALIKASLSEDPVPTADGGISCTSMDLPHNVKLEDARVSFLWRKETISLQKLMANLLGGSLQAEFNASRKQGEMPFDLTTSAAGINLDELLHALDSHSFNAQSGEIRGKTQLDLHVEGSMFEPLKALGHGQLRVQGGRLMNFLPLKFLGSYLKRADEYRDLALQKCEMDFVMESGRLKFPQMEIFASDIHVSGEGWIQFSDRSQNFKLKLALRDTIAASFPEQTLEGATTKDGWVEISENGSLDQILGDLKHRFNPILSRAAGASAIDSLFQALPNK